MKHILVFLAVLCVGLGSATDLSNRYLPPHYAGSSGGHTSFLQGHRPSFRPSNQHFSQRPSNAHYHGVNGAAHFSGSSGTLGHNNQYSQTSGRPQIPILRNDFTNDGQGNYNFGFETGNGIRRDETGRFAGGWPHGSLDVKGSYSYTGDDGRVYTVNYKADNTGFHPEGDHLPTPPPIPREIQESLSLHHSGRGRGSPSGSGSRNFGYGHSASAPSSQYLPPQKQYPTQQGYQYGRKHY